MYTLMMIEDFTLKDIYGSIVEVVYDTEDLDNFHMIMIRDHMTTWAENLGKNSVNLGYIQPDTFVNKDMYTNFEIRVIRMMIETNSEIPWPDYIDYVDFLNLLIELDEIEYDEQGIPHFLN